MVSLISAKILKCIISNGGKASTNLLKEELSVSREYIGAYCKYLIYRGWLTKQTTLHLIKANSYSGTIPIRTTTFFINTNRSKKAHQVVEEHFQNAI